MQNRPGPINDHLNLKSSEFYEIDCRLTEYGFLNAILPSELEIAKKLRLVSQEAWEFLVKRYGGKEIKLFLSRDYNGLVNDGKYLKVKVFIDILAEFDGY
jgi:uncharacterized UBP type Zn finger protein